MITIDKAIEIIQLSGGRTLGDDEAEQVVELLRYVKKCTGLCPPLLKIAEKRSPKSRKVGE